MSSSISSFKMEYKVILLAATIILLAEVAMRFIWPSLNPDLTNYNNFDNKAGQLCQKSEFKLAVLGNSLAINGIFPAQLDEQAAKRSEFRMKTESFALHGSSISEWNLLMDSIFVLESRHPDAILICVPAPTIDGRDEQPSVIRIGWLSMEARPENVIPASGKLLSQFGDRAEMLIGFAFKSFACRDPLRTAALNILVPDYWKGTVHVNDQLKKVRSVDKSSPDKHKTLPPSFEKMRMLAMQAKTMGVRPILVLMPIYSFSGSDEELVTAAKSFGMTVVDCRQLPQISKEMFENDGWHLNPDGGKKLTEHLAVTLPPILSAGQAIAEIPQTGEKLSRSGK